MTQYIHPFDFSDNDTSQIRGRLELEEPLPFRTKSQGGGFYRLGKISLEGHTGLDLVFYHCESTAAFMYMHSRPVDPNLFEIFGFSKEEIRGSNSIRLPGQLCLGSERSRLIGQAIRNILGAPALNETVSNHTQQNLAIFPIAREGLKYQVAEAIYENYGFYCDEIILDAHHVFDSSVPVYNRKVEMTLFKDKDLDKQQHDNIKVAFIADSIASGLVMKEVIAKVKERFDNIQQVEVITPFATVRGLSRIANADYLKNTRVRLHIFETILNALPPDFYYSAHYNIPELHIRPDLEEEYRAWWGNDSAGNSIADTACAGYGWSEVFFSPRKQIEMINSQLSLRHNMTIVDVIQRQLQQSFVKN